MGLWNSDYEDRFSNRVHITKTAAVFIGNDFLPLFSITGMGFKQKTRMHEDPELATSAKEFGWPEDWFTTWKVAEYSPEGEYKSLKKYRVLQRFPPSDKEWEWSYDYMQELFAPVLGNQPAASHSDVVQSMDGTKSAGFPFVIDCQDTYDWMVKYGDKIIPVYDVTGQSWMNLWGNKVKEELRPSEKIALGKVRTFTASNKAYQYAFNRLFLNQTKAFVASGGPHYGHTVGMSKYGRNWHEAGCYLDFFPNKFDYDVDTCDGEVQNHEKTDYMFSKWDFLPIEDRTPANYNVFLHCVVTELFSIVIDAAGTAWLIPNGTKSGSPDTAMSTTWIIKRRFVYAFFKLGKFESYEQAKAAYHEHVRHLGQGDDGAFSVSDQMVTTVNFNTVKAVFEQNGWHISTLSPIPRDLDSIVYLSNWFRKHKGYWIPEPASDKMCVSMAYTRQITPAMSLARAAALYQEGFWSEVLRKRLRLHIARLLRKYKERMEYNREWQIAVGMLKPDSEIERLYLDPSLRGVDSVGDQYEILNTVGAT